MKRIFAAATFCAAIMTGYAAETPKPGALDFRVRTANYNADQVYEITGFFGYHALVLFSQDEKIEKVGGFDSGWQVDDIGNKILITPKMDDADSNLTVITNRRVYFFNLSVKPFPKKYRSQAREREQTYGLRFRYPEDEANAAAALAAGQAAERGLAEALKESSNKPRFKNYTYMGSEAMRPYEVWDDGTFTYFKFYAQQDLPSFFVVNDDETESVVNKFVKHDGDTVVVQRVAKQFVLRMGKAIVCIYNENAPLMTPSSLTGTTSDRIQRVVKGEK